MIKEIPVTLNWDVNETIGVLKIDIDKLPSIPDYHFALGYEALGTNGEHELLQLNVVPDALFKAYEPLVWPTLVWPSSEA